MWERDNDSLHGIIDIFQDSSLSQSESIEIVEQSQI